MKNLGILTLIKILLIFCVVYALILFIPLLFFKYIIVPFFSKDILYLIPCAFLIIIDFFVFLFTAIIITGFAARILNLKYSGENELDLKNPNVFKWLLSLTIYLPTAAIIDFLHLYPLKSFHIKLFGGKIAKNVTVGGFVTDPVLLEVGENTIIGGFSIIMGHAIERGKIKFGNVKIGANCGIGARSTVLAGAVMEDGSLLGAQSLLPKYAVIPAGSTYGGVPARKIKGDND